MDSLVTNFSSKSSLFNVFYNRSCHFSWKSTFWFAAVWVLFTKDLVLWHQKPAALLISWNHAWAQGPGSGPWPGPAPSSGPRAKGRAEIIENIAHRKDAQRNSVQKDVLNSSPSFFSNLFVKKPLVLKSVFPLFHVPAENESSAFRIRDLSVWPF